MSPILSRPQCIDVVGKYITWIDCYEITLGIYCGVCLIHTLFVCVLLSLLPWVLFLFLLLWLLSYLLLGFYIYAIYNQSPFKINTQVMQLIPVKFRRIVSWHAIGIAFWHNFRGMEPTCWTKGRLRGFLSLEVASSIPAWSTIIFRFLCGFYAFLRASKFNKQICFWVCIERAYYLVTGTFR